jgi:ubiquitin C-terminal hydrolase
MRFARTFGVVHFGAVGYGHSKATVRVGDEWFFADDACITKVEDISEVARKTNAILFLKRTQNNQNQNDLMVDTVSGA